MQFCNSTGQRSEAERCRRSPDPCRWIAEAVASGEGLGERVRHCVGGHVRVAEGEEECSPESSALFTEHRFEIDIRSPRVIFHVGILHPVEIGDRTEAIPNPDLVLPCERLAVHRRCLWPVGDKTQPSDGVVLSNAPQPTVTFWMRPYSYMSQMVPPS